VNVLLSGFLSHIHGIEYVWRTWTRKVLTTKRICVHWGRWYFLSTVSFLMSDNTCKALAQEIYLVELWQSALQLVCWPTSTQSHWELNGNTGCFGDWSFAMKKRRGRNGQWCWSLALESSLAVHITGESIYDCVARWPSNQFWICYTAFQPFYLHFHCHVRFNGCFSSTRVSWFCLDLCPVVTEVNLWHMWHMFYWLGALPVTQPTISECQQKNKVLDPC